MLAASLCLTLLAAGGCGGNGSTTTEPEAGKRFLGEVLETWKAGGTPTDLIEKTPPVLVSDPDWNVGSQLVSYEIAPDSQASGNGVTCSVELSLKGKGGKAAKKRAAYQVTTSPPSIFRQD